jgi:hypothetical protein
VAECKLRSWNTEKIKYSDLDMYLWMAVVRYSRNYSCYRAFIKIVVKYNPQWNILNVGKK